MNSLATAAEAQVAPGPARQLAANRPDYCSRALALWPRVDRGRLGRVRHDPGRVAALISHRTNLSRNAILQLLGAPPDSANTTNRDH